MVYKEISNNVKTDNARVKKDNINMKKVIIAIFLLTLCLSFSACTDEEQLVERSIDGIAAYLGYADGEDIVEISEEMSGAKVGKYFSNGQMSIYQFDPESAEYKYQQTQTDTCTGGFVIIYDIAHSEEMANDEIEEQIQKIREMKFE